MTFFLSLFCLHIHAPHEMKRILCLCAVGGKAAFAIFADIRWHSDMPPCTLVLTTWNAHLNRDKIESNLIVPGDHDCNGDALIKSTKICPWVMCLLAITSRTSLVLRLACAFQVSLIWPKRPEKCQKNRHFNEKKWFATYFCPLYWISLLWDQKKWILAIFHWSFWPRAGIFYYLTPLYMRILSCLISFTLHSGVSKIWRLVVTL